MGAWGSESCSNDSCWDHLFCEDIHKCTEAEIEDSLKKCLDHVKMSYSHDREVFLGVVIWGLTHKTKVSPSYLEPSLKIAKDLLKDEDYLSCWTSDEERKNCLLGEIELIKYAIEHDGLPPKGVSAPEGLLEKMFKVRGK